jgi:hypothetical protein
MNPLTFNSSTDVKPPFPIDLSLKTTPSDHQLDYSSPHRDIRGNLDDSFMRKRTSNKGKAFNAFVIISSTLSIDHSPKRI